MSDRVTLTITDGVADVRMNRADKRNALDGAMFQALADVGEGLKTESGVRVVVLSGEGSSFCAGLDFSSFQTMADGGDRPMPGDADSSPGAIERRPDHSSWSAGALGLAGDPVPVIAAVHGHALGGGIQIALGADIRIVHPDTQMSVREVHWGLVPDMTGTLTLSSPGSCRHRQGARLHCAGVRRARGIGAWVWRRRCRMLHRDAAMTMAHEIAGAARTRFGARSAVLNGLLNEGAAEQFAEERCDHRRTDRRAEPGRSGHGQHAEAPTGFIDPA